MMKELQNMQPDEKELTRIVAIIDSMTPRERENHMIINGAGGGASRAAAAPP